MAATTPNTGINSTHPIIIATLLQFIGSFSDSRNDSPWLPLFPERNIAFLNTYILFAYYADAYLDWQIQFPSTSGPALPGVAPLQQLEAPLLPQLQYISQQPPHCQAHSFLYTCWVKLKQFLYWIQNYLIHKPGCDGEQVTASELPQVAKVS